jgi:hypothetical protein
MKREGMRRKNLRVQYTGWGRREITQNIRKNATSREDAGFNKNGKRSKLFKQLKRGILEQL